MAEWLAVNTQMKLFNCLFALCLDCPVAFTVEPVSHSTLAMESLLAECETYPNWADARIFALETRVDGLTEETTVEGHTLGQLYAIGTVIAPACFHPR
jgi:hypothetical protein